MDYNHHYIIRHLFYKKGEKKCSKNVKQEIFMAFLCVFVVGLSSGGLKGFYRINKIMQSQNQFANTTHLFYNRDYEQGKNQITNLIERHPLNSNLFVNRALFLSQLEYDEEAIQDLQRAISLNPRNYIAYFNHFSILTRLYRDRQALQSLCCSLSCLYLVRAKMGKNIEDVEKAIQYSYNNYEAHVLKGLILMERGEYTDAVKSFSKAERINTDNLIIRNLRKLAGTKASINPELQSSFENDVKYQRKLLSSWSIVDDADISQQTQRKLSQFNKLYIDINQNAGAITQKIHKQSVITHTKSSRNEDIKIIYDSGLSTPKHSQVHPQPGYGYIQCFTPEVDCSFHSCSDHDGPMQSFISINNQQEMEKQVHFSRMVDNGMWKHKQKQQFASQFTSVIQQDQLHTDQKQLFVSVISQFKLVQLPLQQKQQHPQQQQNLLIQYNLIYPLDDNSKLKVSVLTLQLSQTDPQKLHNLTDVYCIINYNNCRSKLRTKTKRCEENVCAWYEQFDPIEISPTPSDMIIKIYNKKYKSFRDQFLGDLVVLITTADLLKLPLFHKNGSYLGSLMLNLQLVEVPPEVKVPTKGEGEQDEQ